MPGFADDYFLAWPAARSGERLDEQIRGRVPALSRERLKSAFGEGRVTVGGRPGTAADRPSPGSRLEVSVEADAAGAGRAGMRTEGFFLLYRDPDLVIVDKDPGVLTVPTDEAARADASGEATLVERVAEALDRSARTVFPVHRLDRFTSGLLVIALNDRARAGLIDQFAAHSIVRRYLLITRGVPSPPAGTFRGRLVETAGRKQRVTTGPGERAVTHYEVLEARNGYAVVEAVLETGKRNQIRVHFAEGGWPLLGEHRYVKEPDRSFPRQALHAAELELLHPRLKGPLSAASPLPPDMRSFLGRLSA